MSVSICVGKSVGAHSSVSIPCLLGLILEAVYKLSDQLAILVKTQFSDLENLMTIYLKDFLVKDFVLL